MNDEIDDQELEAMGHRFAVREHCLVATMLLAVRPEMTRARRSPFWYEVFEAARRARKASKIDRKGVYPQQPTN